MLHGANGDRTMYTLHGANGLKLSNASTSDWFETYMSTLLSFYGMQQKQFRICSNLAFTGVGDHLIILMVIFFSTIFVMWAQVLLNIYI